MTWILLKVVFAILTAMSSGFTNDDTTLVGIHIINLFLTHLSILFLLLHVILLPFIWITIFKNNDMTANKAKPP